MRKWETQTWSYLHSACRRGNYKKVLCPLCHNSFLLLAKKCNAGRGKTWIIESIPLQINFRTILPIWIKTSAKSDWISCWAKTDLGGLVVFVTRPFPEKSPLLITSKSNTWRFPVILVLIVADSLFLAPYEESMFSMSIARKICWPKPSLAPKNWLNECK